VSPSTAKRRAKAHEQTVESEATAPIRSAPLRIDLVAEILSMIAWRERIATQLERTARRTKHDGYRIAALMRLDEIRERRLGCSPSSRR